MTPKVPTSDSGRATAGMKVARGERRNRKITATTRTTDMISVICTSRTEARIVSVRSVTMVSWMPDGMALCSRGSAVLHELHGLHDVGARLALDVEHHRRLILVPRGDAVVLDAR